MQRSATRYVHRRTANCSPKEAGIGRWSSTDVKIEQKRGHSRNMDSLKRKLRQLFGGKKSKQEPESHRSTSAAQWRRASSIQNPSTAATTAPQIQPLAPLAPLSEHPHAPQALGASKELPPIQPQPPSQEQRTRDVSPGDHTPQRKSAPLPVIVAGLDGADTDKLQERAVHAVLPEASPAASSGFVSTIEREEPEIPQRSSERIKNTMASEAIAPGPAGTIRLCWWWSISY